MLPGMEIVQLPAPFNLLVGEHPGAGVRPRKKVSQTAPFTALTSDKENNRESAAATSMDYSALCAPSSSQSPSS
jgi:hypothetical protein